MNSRLSLLVLALLTVALVGCNPPAQKKAAVAVHDHGPHGGEKRAIPDCDLVLECVSKPNDHLCEFYFMRNGKEDAVACEFLVALLKNPKDEKSTPIRIPAENMKDGVASKFSLQSEELSEALEITGFDMEIGLRGGLYKLFVPKDPH